MCSAVQQKRVDGYRLSVSFPVLDREGCVPEFTTKTVIRTSSPGTVSDWLRRGIMKYDLAAAAQKMRSKVASELAAWLDGVIQTDFEKVAETHLDVEHIKEKVHVIERYLPGFLTPNKKILEVGSGFGAFTVFCRALYDYDVTGAEPDPATLKLSRELASAAGVDCVLEECAGEKLVFADNTFDLVYSSNVLEHVQDPAKVLSEGIRVLKPGGYLFFTYPNYCSFWEGHYGIVWIPCMSKPVAKLYVRLLGRRNTSYIDSLQLVNVRFTKKILKTFQDQVDVISLGDDLWEDRLRNLNFGEWGLMSNIKKMLAFIHKLPFVLDLGIKVGKWMNWYYPIILVLRKKTDSPSG